MAEVLSCPTTGWSVNDKSDNEWEEEVFAKFQTASRLLYDTDENRKSG